MYVYIYIYMHIMYNMYAYIYIYIHYEKKESVTNLSACLPYLLKSAMVKCKKNGSWTANIHGSYLVTGGLSSSQNEIQVA